MSKPAESDGIDRAAMASVDQRGPARKRDRRARPSRSAAFAIKHDLWVVGPNLTGYAGGYPNGFIAALRRTPWWGPRRLHVCAGSVKDGTTVDVNPETNPSVVADAEDLPFPDSSFDTVVMDPPYSEREARDIYGVPYLSVPKALREGMRVLEPGGHLILLHRNTYSGVFKPREAPLIALIAIHMGGRNVGSLRALQVWMKPGGKHKLTDFGKNGQRRRP